LSYSFTLPVSYPSLQDEEEGSVLYEGFLLISLFICTSSLISWKLLLFAFAYIFGVLRSLFAKVIGYKIITAMGIKYIRPWETNIKSKIKKVLFLILNEVFWLINLIIWSVKQKSSFYDMKVLFNRILNSFSAYVSFLFIFMIINAAEIFVCTKQRNGSSTLNESPNILW
jgi:hypothetical protein